MSKYTTEVRYICETASGLDESVGFDDVETVIDESVESIFNFDFPIFDEDYRIPLEKKILRHYYTREIGLETVGLWKLKLSTKLNEIMPYYNKLYNSELIEFNPMENSNMVTIHQGEKNGLDEGSGNSKNTGVSKGVNRDLYSDTPQGGLTGVENETYLTNARKVTDNNIANSSSEAEYQSARNEDEYFIHKMNGKLGGSSYSSYLQEFRKTFLNIDMMVINELKDLFMNIW